MCKPYKHWLTRWYFKKVESLAKKALKRSLFKYLHRNDFRIKRYRYLSTKYLKGAKNMKDFKEWKRWEHIYHRQYMKEFLTMEAHKIFKKIIRLVFPKNIRNINRYKAVLPTVTTGVISLLAKAACQTPSQVIASQLSYSLIAPSLSALQQLKSSNVARFHFDENFTYNSNNLEDDMEEVMGKDYKNLKMRLGVQKSVKSLDSYFENIHFSDRKDSKEVFIPSVSFDKIVIFDTTSSKILPLSFKNSFGQFYNWLFLCNQKNIIFHNFSSEIRVLSIDEIRINSIDKETLLIINQFFSFLYDYPFLISSFFKYLIDFSAFEFYDIHLCKLSITLKKEEIDLFLDDSGSCSEINEFAYFSEIIKSEKLNDSNELFN